jgi:type I restriction enzyme S subunit
LKYPVHLPTLSEQKAIAATLSALDDMIELNNQINKTLEEMAQAIFKSWFVDFEPFRDGEFEESEIGPIPKGWKVGMLGDFVEIVDNRGKTPPLSDVKTEYPIIDVRALSGESRVIDYSNCTKYVEKEIYDSWFRSGHPKHLDILISTVGSIAEMKMFYGNKGCIAQNVVAFRSNGISPCYLYQYLQYSKGDLLSYNIGSVQPSIKVTHVIKYKIIVPDEKTMSSFDMLMESISDQIHRNANESQILIAIRDTLLPKLISGEIRVPVEEVV